MNPSGTVLSLPTVNVRPESVVTHGGAEWGLGTASGQACLVVRASSRPQLDGFEGDVSAHDDGVLLVGPASARNAAGLRTALPWLMPAPIGQRISFGFGDRLGLATPGHIRALRVAGGDITPVFAQQSARELIRTNRTAQAVMDAATWGAFGKGWTAPQGADADHLKATADIDAYLAAGFSMFTIDPGDHVGRIDPQASPADLLQAYEELPWPALEDAPADALRRYAGRTMAVDGRALAFTDADVLRAAAKYGRAVLHVTRMYRHLMSAAGSRPVELEVSVDETDDPTTYLEHIYVATELKRLGVVWSSLAPRLAGRFEKGVDYIGDVVQFDADWGVHASIARQLGPYRLSLHSGSDKFSIYGRVAAHAHGAVHVKTAGTSWLEATRTVAAVDPQLFREIYAISYARYDEDRASYHVSASTERAPKPGATPDAALPALLDHFDARQILHVAFGSVLKFRAAASGALMADLIGQALRANADRYADDLEAHFIKHLRPFAS